MTEPIDFHDLVRCRLQKLFKGVLFWLFNGVLLITLTWLSPLPNSLIELELWIGVLLYIGFLLPPLCSWRNEVRYGYQHKTQEVGKWGFYSLDRPGPWLYFIDVPLCYHLSHLQGYEFYSEWLIIRPSGWVIVNPGVSTVEPCDDASNRPRVHYRFERRTAYAWDGCSPKYWLFWYVLFGTSDGWLKRINFQSLDEQGQIQEGHRHWPITARASLLHDVMCQYLHEIPLSKPQVDRLFLTLMCEDGVPRPIAYWYFLMSCLFGGKQAHSNRIAQSCRHQCITRLPCEHIA